MRLLNSKSEEGEMLADNYTQFYISKLVKSKDYNKINSKLKTYHCLLFDLQNPNFSDVKQVFIIQNNLKQLMHTMSEINLSCDEIIQDFYTIGFKTHSEAFDNLFSALKMLNEYLIKSLNQQFYLLKAENVKNNKFRSQLCLLCQESQEGTLLKRIKTQFGMDYPFNKENQENEKIKRAKQDLVIRQKQDYIDQVNNILNKKENVLKISPQSWRYRELLSSLNKMSKLDQEIQQRRQKKKASCMNNAQMTAQQGQELEEQYQQILNEVKQILNSKFKEGYSHRVRTMLDKFQIVLKKEKDKKVEKRIFINIKDEGTQTSLTSESIQIKVLKDNLSKKEFQLCGIKEAKTILEQRFNISLENQRKITKNTNQNIMNLIKNEDTRQLLTQKIKENDALKREISRLYEKLNKKTQKHPQQQIKNKSKTIENQPMVDPMQNFQNCVLKNYCQQKACKQTQTDPNYILTECELGFDQQGLEKISKKKLIKRMSKQFITSGHHQSLISKKIDQIDQQNKLTIEAKVFNILILSTHFQEQRLSSLKFEETKKVENPKINQKQNEEPHTSQSFKKNSPYNKMKKMSKANKSKMKLFQKLKTQNGKQTSELSLTLAKSQPQQIITFDVNNNSKKTKFINTEQRVQSRRSPKTKLNSKFVRLEEMANKFRLNAPKGDNSALKFDNSSVVNKKSRRDSVIKISRYQNQRVSRSIDRQKVKQIVALLKIQKNNNPMSNRYKYANFFDKIESSDNNFRFSSDKSNECDNFETNPNFKEQEELANKSIAENILNAKLIISAEYSFLYASGFIDYLFSLEKRMRLSDKNSVKYKFQFKKIDQDDIKLFGGIQQFKLYYKNIGIWKTLLDQEHELNLNYTYRKFAQKISKYFFLLRKMNRQFFQHYSSFLFTPFEFAMTHFGSEIKNQICSSIENMKEPTKGQEVMINQESLTLIMIRLLKYHQISHGDCQHIPQFLDKIGYYRYAT